MALTISTGFVVDDAYRRCRDISPLFEEACREVGPRSRSGEVAFTSFSITCADCGLCAA